MVNEALETISQASERYGIPYKPLYMMCRNEEVKAMYTGTEWLIDAKAMQRQIDKGLIGVYRARSGKMGWHGDAAGTVVYSEPGMRLAVAVGSKNIKSNTRAVFYGYRWLGTGEDERRKFVGKLDDVEARWRDWAAKPIPSHAVAEARRVEDAKERVEATVEEDGEPKETVVEARKDKSDPITVPVETSIYVSKPTKPILYSVTYSRPDGGSVNVVAFTDEQKALSAAIEYGRVIEAIGVAGDFSVDEVPIGWD